MKTSSGAPALPVWFLVAACSASHGPGADSDALPGTSAADRAAPPPAANAAAGSPAQMPAQMRDPATASSPPVSASTTPIPMDVQCRRLESDARNVLKMAIDDAGVPQCELDYDCERHHVFSPERDACWASCGGTIGSDRWVTALREAAKDACKEFFAAGCKVLPAGCPFAGPAGPSAGVPATPACFDGMCGTK